MGDNIKGSYQAAIQMLSTETQTVWRRYNAFLTANSIIITAMTIASNSNQASGISRILPSLGILICMIWGIITMHGFCVCRKYAYYIRYIENSAEMKFKILNSLRSSKGGWVAPLTALSTMSLFLLLYHFMYYAALNIKPSESIINYLLFDFSNYPNFVTYLFLMYIIALLCTATYLYFKNGAWG